MAQSHLLAVLLIAIFLTTAVTAEFSGLSVLGDHITDALITSTKEGSCVDGFIGECAVSADDETELGNADASARRNLGFSMARVRQARQNYISYGVLNKNQIPCSQRGRSYYNCYKHGRANPYNRGCSYITRCARYLN